MTRRSARCGREDVLSPTVALVQQWSGFADASKLAEQVLGRGTVRFRHSTGVAAAAARASAAVPHGDVDLLVAAAWLHDIGYAPSLSETGFHPLDGARYLRSIGAPARLCRLVANHTGAWLEAANRGLINTLTEEFPPEASDTSPIENGPMFTGTYLTAICERARRSKVSADRSEGDWNGDGIFDSSDMVTAFVDGGYEKGPRMDAEAVPEPGGWLLLVLGMLLTTAKCRTIV